MKFLASSIEIGGQSFTFDSTLAYENLVSSAVWMEAFVVILSYFCGFVMIFRGFALYKSFGQNINQNTRPGEVAGPIVYIIIGVFMFYFPDLFKIVMYTVFGTTTPTQLNYDGSDVNWQHIYILIDRYCKLVGVISFFRGLLLVSKSGEPGVQPGTITRGTIHIIAGVMLYNIGATVEILEYTFGLTLT